MANNITIYKGNSKTIVCTVSGLDSLSGYTAKMTVKKNAALDSSDPIIESTGLIDGLNVVFSLTATDTAIAVGLYMYDVVITNGTNVYTVAQDRLQISESVSM